jgi:hypothetical protein
MIDQLLDICTTCRLDAVESSYLLILLLSSQPISFAVLEFLRKCCIEVRSDVTPCARALCAHLVASVSLDSHAHSPVTQFHCTL